METPETQPTKDMPTIKNMIVLWRSRAIIIRNAVWNQEKESYCINVDGQLFPVAQRELTSAYGYLNDADMNNRISDERFQSITGSETFDLIKSIIGFSDANFEFPTLEDPSRSVFVPFAGQKFRFAQPGSQLIVPTFKYLSADVAHKPALLTGPAAIELCGKTLCNFDMCINSQYKCMTIRLETENWLGLGDIKAEDAYCSQAEAAEGLKAESIPWGAATLLHGIPEAVFSRKTVVQWEDKAYVMRLTHKTVRLYGGRDVTHDVTYHFSCEFETGIPPQSLKTLNKLTPLGRLYEEAVGCVLAKQNKKVDEPAEPLSTRQIVNDFVLPSIPDCVYSLTYTGQMDDEGEDGGVETTFCFNDHNDKDVSRMLVTSTDILNAARDLREKLLAGEFKGLLNGLSPEKALENPETFFTDAEVVDTIVQLAAFGDVIYS